MGRRKIDEGVAGQWGRRKTDEGVAGQWGVGRLMGSGDLGH